MKQRFLNFKGLLALALGVVTIASTGCNKPEPEVPTLPSLSVKANGAEVVNNQTITIGKAGGEIALTVATNRAWTATAADSFVIVTPVKGEANEEGVSVIVTVAANSGEARTSTVTVATTTDNKTVAFKIAQEGEVVPVGDIAISEIRAMGETTITADKTLIATIISDASTSGGNSTSKKNIVIQDGTAGIAIRLTADPEDGQFAVGDLVSIKVKDLVIAKYDDLLQLNNVPNALLEKVGTNVIERKEITAAELLSGEYESQLVAVKDVQFVSDVTGKAIGDGTSHVSLGMESSDGKSFIAFVSRYSTFIGTSVPEGSGTIKGIGSINKGAMQILPQTASDFDGMTGARFAEAPKFGVAKTAVNVAAAGGEATVDVTGNVDWTVTVKEGAEYLSAGPTPASGNSEGTISLTFKENTSTEATPTVTITVSTAASVATQSYDIVFTQAKAASGGGGTTGSLLFPGSDFNDWDAFVAGLSSHGLKDYAVQSATGGRNGSSALHINGTPTGNDYVFTALVPATAPAVTKTISFYIKGTAAKSLSMNVYLADGSYKAFNLGDCTGDATLEVASGNQYTGVINTGGNWAKVTLNVEGLDIAKTAGESLFAIKVGKNEAYDLLIDDITFDEGQGEGPGGSASVLFPGSDFNDWAAFEGCLNSYGLQYAVQSTDGGRDGSGALHINTTPSANGYVFTALVPETAPAVTKSISFYIKGTAGKSLSMNVYKANGTNYNCFNLGDCTADATLSATGKTGAEENGTNSYTGVINTGGNWVKVTIDLGDMVISSTAGTSLFALKVGKDQAYDLYVDDITFE